MSVLVRSSVQVPEKALAGSEKGREPAAASRGLFTSAGGLSEILLPLLCLDFLQLAPCTSHIQGAWTEVDSRHHQQSHQWPPNLKRKSLIS